MAEEQEKPPTAFISYSWDEDAHKTWVRDFAARLRGEGVDVKLDQWETVHGDQLPHFMERAIRENDYVLIVCTPNYKDRSDHRRGGAGYEGDIMSGELLGSRNHRKFIPILRSGTWTTSLPTWLGGKFGVDLKGDPYSEEQFDDLLRTIYKQHPGPPPLGKSPFSGKTPQPAPPPVSGNPAAAASAGFEPIKILNVVVDEVTTPRMDGTRGSALYGVPLQLSRRPPFEWADIFVNVWNWPPEFTTRHRPGIARVEGDRVILDGTTMEELEQVHRATLRGVLNETNRRYAEFEAARRRKEELRLAKEDQHKRDVQDRAKKITFDDF